MKKVINVFIYGVILLLIIAVIAWLGINIPKVVAGETYTYSEYEEAYDEGYNNACDKEYYEALLADYNSKLNQLEDKKKSENLTTTEQLKEVEDLTAEVKNLESELSKLNEELYSDPTFIALNSEFKELEEYYNNLMLIYEKCSILTIKELDGTTSYHYVTIGYWHKLDYNAIVTNEVSGISKEYNANEALKVESKFYTIEYKEA